MNRSPRRIANGTTIAALALLASSMGWSCSNNDPVSERSQGEGLTLEGVVAEYDGYGDQRALAIAVQGEGRWAYGVSFDVTTEEAAVSHALAACRRHARQDGLEADCRMYAVGARIVWGDQRRPIDEYADHLPPKAFAFAVDGEGRWAYGVSFGESDEGVAADSALAECELRRPLYKVDAACGLYAVGDAVTPAGEMFAIPDGIGRLETARRVRKLPPLEAAAPRD